MESAAAAPALRERQGNKKHAWATAADYAPGTLEDWIADVLRFTGQPATARVAADNFKTADMDRNNLLIETVFKAEAGNADLVRKLGPHAGYRLSLDGQGRPVFHLQASPTTATVTGSASLLDGQWQHPLVEADRRAKTATIYLDGQGAATVPA